MGKSGNRIGLLGGTFNPIHCGHLQVAQIIQKKLKLHRVLFIPTGTAPHKKAIASPSKTDRLKMVRLALKSHPDFKPSDIEIKRPGISYTIDTVMRLKQRHPQDTFFFIIGTDAFSHLPKWKAPEQLLRLCHFVIVPRPGHPFLPLPTLPGLDRIDTTALTQLSLGKRSRYTFSGKQNKLYFFSIPTTPIAASDIRKRINSGKDVATLLPPPVLSYIMRKGLYRSDTPRTKENDS